jgi:flavin reductase (DIM6/NTAB) family NADH-FMN oxidoreductase RutF
VNASSAPLARGESEFAHAGLEPEPSTLVKPPRIKGIAAALECKLVDIVRLRTHDGRDMDAWLALGHVIGVYIDDRFIKDGRFDTAAAQPIARCGYADYAVVDKLFSIRRPPGAG